MPKSVTVTLAVSFGLFVSSAVAAGAEQGVTWRREYVRQWEIGAVERALGKQAAEEYSVVSGIVGGVKAAAGKWPFHVGLLDAGVANKYNAHFCGGALVNKLFVVTAAHCVYGSRASEIHVLTGTQSLTKGGVRHGVAAIKIHPSYNNSTSDYDIAVIKLKTAATGLALSSLISATQQPAFAAAGKHAIVTGWGNVSAKGSNFPADLRQVELPLVDTRDCNDGNSYGGAITGRMICAGYTAGGKDACDGDSGGPLVVKDRQGVWALQVGIVSWGAGCAQRNFFGVYARVAVLSTWANNIISGHGAAHSSSDCEVLTGQAQTSCIDAAIAANGREMLSYLDILRGTTDPAVKAAAAAGQAAWSKSLDGLCAFDRAARGEAGRKLCVLKEMEKRAATLAEKLSVN